MERGAARDRGMLLIDVLCYCGFAAAHELSLKHYARTISDLFRVYFPSVMGRMHRQANSKDVTLCILYPAY